MAINEYFSKLVFGEVKPSKVETRVCRECKIEKSLEEFHRNSSSTAGRRYDCKKCRNTSGRKDSKAAYKLMKKYNISRPKLGTDCSCCGKTEKPLVCDHIHGTDTIRGFICDDCNVGIGRLGDNLSGLENAIKYLSGKYLT
jgi:hypothetical protein